MLGFPENLANLDAILAQVIDDWFDRVRNNYVTEEDSRLLRVEPELKIFHESGNHRIKFARERELDVTYGLASDSRANQLMIASSVNNKSKGFEYDVFVERLKDHYWASRNEKPWTDRFFDHFAYGDLLTFEPRIGQFVRLDPREEGADIIRLFFHLDPEHEQLLMNRTDILKDLVENYCLAPLRRTYAECYRGG